MLVHGGAWAIPDDALDAHLHGVEAAAAQGWQVLQRGGGCLDAVEAAVVAMEEDEAFDAGRGSFLNMDGRVQLDALMMEGATLRAGGVGCVEHIRNPIRAAKKVLTESPHVYFVGTGAERFAQQHGIELCANDELVIEREVLRLREAKKQGYLADARRVRPHAFERHSRGRGPRSGRQHRGCHFDRRNAEQSAGPRGRFLADRLRLLRRQPQRRGFHHRLGRTDDEIGPQQVGRRPRRGWACSPGGCATRAVLPESQAERTWRDHHRRCQRKNWPGPQYASYGVVFDHQRRRFLGHRSRDYEFRVYAVTVEAPGFVWQIGADGLIASSQGHFDSSEYQRQLEHGVQDPR